MSVLTKIFSDIKKQFKYDYQNNRAILWLECIGTLTGIMGALLLSILGDDIKLGFIICFYTVSSTSWLIAMLKRNNSFGIVLNFAFTLINIIGLVNQFVL